MQSSPVLQTVFFSEIVFKNEDLIMTLLPQSSDKWFYLVRSSFPILKLIQFLRIPIWKTFSKYIFKVKKSGSSFLNSIPEKNTDYAEDCFAIFLNYQSENKRLDRYLGLRVTCLVVYGRFAIWTKTLFKSKFYCPL